MAVYNCKICGAPLEVTQGSTLVTCQYCDTPQSVSMFDTEFSSNALSRAENYLNEGSYAAAENLFSAFTVTNPEDYRGWWGQIRCKTKNFTLMLEDTTELLQYFALVKQNADSSLFPALQQRYFTYLQNISLPLGQTIKAELQKRKDNPSWLINKRQTELNALQAQYARAKAQYDERQAEITERLNRYHSRVGRLKTAQTILGIIGLVTFVLLGAVGGNVFAMLGMVPLIAAAMLFHLYPIDNTKSDYAQKRGLMEGFELASQQHEGKISILQKDLSLAQQDAVSFAQYLACPDTHIAQAIYLEKSCTGKADATACAIFRLTDFCPICGFVQNKNCTWCKDQTRQNVHPSQAEKMQLKKEDFLPLVEHFSDTCQMENFVEQYLIEHPNGIDPRIVRIVQSQAKIERSYGNTKKSTIKMIQNLE